MDHIRHPERKSRDPDEVTLKISLRDPSTSLGMTAHLFLLAWNFIKAVQYKPDG